MDYYKIRILKLLSLLTILVLFYFIFLKGFYFIDLNVSLLLNKLLNHKIGQYFFGVLSHKNESWINVIIMLGINIISIFFVNKNYSHLSRKKYQIKAIFIILYCWLSYQVVLLINNIIFQKWLQVNRDSPSLVITDFIRLSKILNNLNIKDYSHNSFPAGHALILIYWILFVNLYANKIIKVISWLLGILLVFPRMVTGAHWFSDTIFSVLLGWIYFDFSMWLATSYEKIKKSIH